MNYFNHEISRWRGGWRTAAAIAMVAPAALFALRAVPAKAADFTVAPAVIDGNGIPNDIFSYTLTVTNTSGRLENVFASVYELTAAGDQAFVDPATSDRPALLADWIGITRGAMLFQPGETKKIPVTVTINPYATAGDYHAVIAFVAGDTRAAAEANLNGAPQALINFTIASDAKELLQLASFGPSRHFYSSFPVSVDYAIKNIGDVPSTPGGSVIFYDGIGHELGSVPVNPANGAIAPGATQSFTATWGGSHAMGQYRVGIQATYGAADAQLSDEALFWVLPWRQLLTVFLALLAAVVIAASLLHRSYLKRHHRRRQLIESLLRARDNKHVVDLRHPGSHPDRANRRS